MAESSEDEKNENESQDRGESTTIVLWTSV